MDTTHTTPAPTLSDLSFAVQTAKFELEDAQARFIENRTTENAFACRAAIIALEACQREHDLLAEVVAEHNRTTDIGTFIWTLHGKLHKQPTALGFASKTGDRDLAIRRAIAGLVSEARGGDDVDPSAIDFYEFTF